jgi:hypothetical protein
MFGGCWDYRTMAADDVFIEAPAKSDIIANKSGGNVLKPLAHS